MSERKPERTVQSGQSETERRVALARVVCERKRAELGEHLLSVACYGSVAHNAAGPHSDLELALLADDTLELTYEPFMMDGVMGQCDILPASRMLRAASKVSPKWGIEADQHRCHLVLWDPGGWFARVQAAAHNLADEDFTVAIEAVWERTRAWGAPSSWTSSPTGKTGSAAPSC